MARTMRSVENFGSTFTASKYYSRSLLIRRERLPRTESGRAKLGQTRLPLKAELAKGIAHGTQPAFRKRKRGIASSTGISSMRQVAGVVLRLLGTSW